MRSEHQIQRDQVIGGKERKGTDGKAIWFGIIAAGLGAAFFLSWAVGVIWQGSFTSIVNGVPTIVPMGGEGFWGHVGLCFVIGSIFFAAAFILVLRLVRNSN